MKTAALVLAATLIIIAGAALCFGWTYTGHLDFWNWTP